MPDHTYLKAPEGKLLPLLVSTLIGIGTTGASAASSEEEFRHLLEILEEETTIATKTRLNADYVPGMVTVLHGAEMARSGSRTVWEALSKVPGIELSIEETGRKQVVVRGMGRTYASGNIKVMLNGTAMNTAQTGYASPVLNIPIEQVERIEVIRGPGSAVHGEYAYTGVVNVITRSGERSAFVHTAEGKRLGGGGLYSYRSAESDLSVDMSASHWAEDGIDIDSGEDDLYRKGIGQLSHAPGPSNEKLRQSSATLSVERSGHRLNLQWLEDGYGDHFGINEYLPPDEKRIVTENRYYTAELGKRTEHSDQLSSDLYFGISSYREEKDRLYLCAPSNLYTAGEDFVCNTDDMGWDPALGDIIANTHYRERRFNLGLQLNWQPSDKHQTLLAYEWSQTETRKNSSLFGQTDGDLYHFELIEEGTSRRLNSLTLQDEYRPTDAFTVTFGLRHDDYSDVGGNTTPRLAAVYRLDRRHIFKAQYARAFRPPTFYELAGQVEGETIEPATVDTFEAGYIFKGSDDDIRLTLFYSALDDPITFVDDYPRQGFTNVDNARLYGAEAEWEHRFTRRIDLSGNLSLLESKNDDQGGSPLSGSADWLANIGLNIVPTPRTQLNLHYRYVGPVHRAANDTRDKLDAYDTLDLTFNWSQGRSNGYILRLGVKNALDSDVAYPAPTETYPSDHTRPGRLWWAGMKYQF
ncbi:MAG: TonB-dependent receptor plug domain-containing protein [Pseudomonadota bacterium]